jgi:hypothetical protein
MHVWRFKVQLQSHLIGPRYVYTCKLNVMLLIHVGILYLTNVSRDRYKNPLAGRSC